MQLIVVSCFALAVLMAFQLRKAASCLYMIQENKDSSGSWSDRVAVPLLNVKVNGSLFDTVGQVTVTQTYFNNFSRPIEANYLFNLDFQSTIVHFSMVVGGNRTLVGKVMERERARFDYNEAVQKQNQTASILERFPNGEYRVKVGGIDPGETICVVYSYVTSLEIAQNGQVKFVLPTNISPKYGGSNPPISRQDATTPSPNIFLSPNEKLFKFDLTFTWKSKTGIAFVKSHTAKIIVRPYSTTDRNTVVITAEAYPQRGDFNLFMKPERFDPAVYYEEDGDDVYLMVLHRGPPAVKTAVSTPTNALKSNLELDLNKPNEFIIVVDRSGSMESQVSRKVRASSDSTKEVVQPRRKIDDAREAVALFVQSLPMNSLFNVVSFGSDYRFLFPSSVPYTNSNKATALAEITSFEANFGGTELFACLQSVLSDAKSTAKASSSWLWSEIVNLVRPAGVSSQSSKGTAGKTVILITDGDIMNIDAVVLLARQANSQHGHRIFTIGVGQDVNRALVERIAAASQATSQVLIDEDDLSSTVIGLMETAVNQPYYAQTQLILETSTSAKRSSFRPSSVVSERLTNVEQSLSGMKSQTSATSTDHALYPNQFAASFYKLTKAEFSKLSRVRVISTVRNARPLMTAQSASIGKNSTLPSRQSDSNTREWIQPVFRDEVENKNATSTRANDDSVFRTNQFGILARLYAANRIRELESMASEHDSEQSKAIDVEIVRLSSKYNIMSSRTSFLVIDTIAMGSERKGSMLLVDVPQVSFFDFDRTQLLAHSAGLASMRSVSSKAGHVRSNQKSFSVPLQRLASAFSMDASSPSAATESSSAVVRTAVTSSLFDGMLFAYQSVDGSVEVNNESLQAMSTSRDVLRTLLSQQFMDKLNPTRSDAQKEHFLFNLLVLKRLKQIVQSTGTRKYAMIEQKLARWLSQPQHLKDNTVSISSIDQMLLLI